MRFPGGVAIRINLMYDLINRAGRSRAARIGARARTCVCVCMCVLFVSDKFVGCRGETALNSHRAFYRRLSGLTGTLGSADDCATV